MGRVKALMPSLREKKRYIVFEILSKDKISAFSSVNKEIWNSMLSYNGELESGKAGLNILPEKYNKKLQRGIMRVNNTYTERAKAALVLVDKIEGKKVLARSIATSGMIKKAGQYIAG